MRNRRVFALLGLLVTLFGLGVLNKTIGFIAKQNKRHKMTMAQIKEAIVIGATEKEVRDELGIVDQSEPNAEIYWGSDGVVGIWYEEGRVYKVFTKRVDLSPN